MISINSKLYFKCLLKLYLKNKKPVQIIKPVDILTEERPFIAGKIKRSEINMKCYGKSYLRHEECPRCELAAYCREAADLPLMVMHPGRALEWDNRTPETPPEADEPTPGSEVYSRADLLEVIGFMASLDFSTLDFLRAKLADPEISFTKLAKQRDISRQAVHKFIRDRCLRNPELAIVMQNRGQKIESNLKKSFMEEVCRIRRKTRARKSNKPKAASNSSKKLICSIRSFDLSKMNILSGGSIWKNASAD